MNTVDAILEAIGPSCRDTTRREQLLDLIELAKPGPAPLNGIDFVEFDAATLHVHFLGELPFNEYGLTADPSSIRVHGGTRITSITVLSAVRQSDYVLDVQIDLQGDFSPYLLSIGWMQQDNRWVFTQPVLDRRFSVASVNFRPGCRLDIDCKDDTGCTPETPAEPDLDYLARDYASFRQLLVDLVTQRNPGWTEQNAADIGVMLLELLAYEGDHLAYMQDAVATEMYLDTARRRESVKRHARLIDYRMHDGANASTHVHFHVSTAGVLPAGTRLLTTINEPLQFQQTATEPIQPTTPPGSVIERLAEDAYDHDPALALVQVFETPSAAQVHPIGNELRLHAWGDQQCCLPRGYRMAHLYAVDPDDREMTAANAVVAQGDLLLLEEVRGPESGLPVDADRTHRQIVTVIDVRTVTDPLYLAKLHDGKLQQTTNATLADSKLTLTEVTWAREEGLAFPLWLSTVLDDGTVVGNLSVARGNIVAADHGRTVVEQVRVDRLGNRPQATLTGAPLTMARTDDGLEPAVSLAVVGSEGHPQPWESQPDLLSSKELDAHFVVDVDHRGRATLRFGDGEYGRSLAEDTALTATYRVGNGRSGNVGAKALRHIAYPQAAPPGAPTIIELYNPLPAGGGVEPQTIEEVRQLAPAAFHTQRRAVTAEDYRHAALSAPGVAGAAAAFRWTGSWHTVYVGIDPADPADLVAGHARADLAPALRQRVLGVLESYRLAGYDLEIVAPKYVPLTITLQVCARRGYFGGDVANAVARALSGGDPGRTAVFDPSRLTFGQPVHLSTVYAAASAVPGVESVHVSEFHRYGRPAAGELDRGIIAVGAWEIARLDNDPNLMENGTLVITAGGGS